VTRCLPVLPPLSTQTGDRRRRRTPAKRILHDLRLLLHPVRVKRLALLQPVVVGAPADPQRAVQQIAELGRGTSAEIAPPAPRLVLAAVRQLVRQNSKKSFTSI